MLFEHLFPITAGSAIIIVCAVGSNFNTMAQPYNATQVVILMPTSSS
jgi:hypothetical protein